MCDISDVHAYSPGPTRIRVQGTISNSSCKQLRVRLDESGISTPVEAVFDWPQGLDSAGDTFSVELIVEEGFVYQYCKNGEVPLHIECIDGDTTCDPVRAVFAFRCCPSFSIQNFRLGDCQYEATGNYRPVQFTAVFNWEGFEGEAELLLTLTPEGDSQPSYAATLEASPEPGNPDSSIFTQDSFSSFFGPPRARAGFTYRLRLILLEPDFCDEVFEVPDLQIPACDCPAIPQDLELLIVRNADGSVVADPNNTGRVTSDTASVTVNAAGDPNFDAVSGSWQVSGAAGAIVTEDANDPNLATVTMPGSGALVVVSVLVGLGDCAERVFVTLRRDLPLPCAPLPDDYALVVMDLDGAIVPEGSCVPASPAIVRAPDHADSELDWTIDGQPVQADGQRSIPVSLEAGASVTVVATVGRDECRREFSRTLMLCESECTPIPEDFALEVADGDGNLVPTGECVPVSPAVVTAPPHADGQISWTVDGQSVTPAAGSPRTLVIPLAENTSATVTASVGRDSCRRAISRVLTLCGEARPRPPRIDWCAVALVILLLFAFFGAVLLGVSLCLIGWLPEGVATIVAIIAAVIGGLLLFVSLLGLLVWLVLCGSCGRGSSCLLLDILLSVLLFFTVSSLAATAVGTLISIFGPGKLCFLGWLIDSLGFGLIYTIALWWSYFVGCNPYPRWVPVRWRFTAPSILRVVCRAIGNL